MDAENKRILLTQEAKPECRGQWYLPAGRIDPGESLSTAACREVLEETGMVIEPKGIFAVDYQPFGNSTVPQLWLRYCIAGSVTGGTLKTVEDKESMSAAWFTEQEFYALAKQKKLRALDALAIYELFKKNPVIPMSD